MGFSTGDKDGQEKFQKDAENSIPSSELTSVTIAAEGKS